MSMAIVLFAAVALAVLLWQCAVPYSAFGGGTLGQKTAAAATPYYQKIDPFPNYGPYTCVFQINYTNGNTANAITAMRPIGRALVAAASNTSVNTITLASDPSATGNTIAAGDQIVFAAADGTFRQGQVGSWNGTTKVLSLSANLAANVSSGARMWNFGVFNDTDPSTGVAFPSLPTVANTTANAYTGQVAGIRGAQVGDPILLYNPNATAQSILNFVEYAYAIE